MLATLALGFALAMLFVYFLFPFQPFLKQVWKSTLYLLLCYVVKFLPLNSYHHIIDVNSLHVIVHLVF